MSTQTPPTVLIIDNDEAVVHAIATRLGPLGYNCITACTGAQGLAQFIDCPIDLVVTDLNMPLLDGTYLINEIRSVSQVPILVVTGFEREYTDQLRDQPRVTIIKKPFRVMDLIDLIEIELAYDTVYRVAG